MKKKIKNILIVVTVSIFISACDVAYIQSTSENDSYISSEDSSEQSNQTSTAGITMTEQPSTEAASDSRPQKDGFNKSTNNVVTVENYDIEVPKYFKPKKDKEVGITKYSAYVESDEQIATIEIEAFDDTDKVSFDALYADDNNMKDMIKSWFDDPESITSNIFETPSVKGILYKCIFKSKIDGKEYHGSVQLLAIPSNVGNRWIFVEFVNSDNTEFSYTNDFTKIISSITEHEDAEDAPNTVISFSKENAIRVAVVAITNAYATDVFKDDGNNYDVSKFHSYDDLNGDYFTVENEGESSLKEANTWHIENLKLVYKGTQGVVNASLDVSYDGEKYEVSNVTGTYGNEGASKDYQDDISEIESAHSHPYLSVTAEQIKNGR